MRKLQRANADADLAPSEKTWGTEAANSIGKGKPNPMVGKRAHTHTQTHTHKHTRKYIRTRTRKYTHALAHTHTRTHARTHARTHESQDDIFEFAEKKGRVVRKGYENLVADRAKIKFQQVIDENFGGSFAPETKMAS